MAFQAAIASSVNHTVRLPRCRSALLYAAQFVTRRFGRGIWWRRSALYLCGMKARSGASKQATPYAIPHIRATRWRTAENAYADRLRWLEKAAAETDPEQRAGWEQLAEVEFDVASSAQADADDLLAQFRAAGGEMSLNH